MFAVPNGLIGDENEDDNGGGNDGDDGEDEDPNDGNAAAEAATTEEPIDEEMYNNGHNDTTTEQTRVLSGLSFRDSAFQARCHAESELLNEDAREARFRSIADPESDICQDLRRYLEKFIEVLGPMVVEDILSVPVTYYDLSIQDQSRYQFTGLPMSRDGVTIGTIVPNPSLQTLRLLLLELFGGGVFLEFDYLFNWWLLGDFFFQRIGKENPVVWDDDQREMVLRNDCENITGRDGLKYRGLDQLETANANRESVSVGCQTEEIIEVQATDIIDLYTRRSPSPPFLSPSQAPSSSTGTCISSTREVPVTEDEPDLDTQMSDPSDSWLDFWTTPRQEAEQATNSPGFVPHAVPDGNIFRALGLDFAADEQMAWGCL